jgi:hypothetical protein
VLESSNSSIGSAGHQIQDVKQAQLHTELIPEQRQMLDHGGYTSCVLNITELMIFEVTTRCGKTSLLEPQHSQVLASDYGQPIATL